ncbi:MAG: hypothetical protein V2A72_00270 [Candidatus Omnitrophota bacterium]
MPNEPQKQEKEDSKEVRLFGEKSIREEAYRQKIMQLEKELMLLEGLAQSKKKENLENDAQKSNEVSELDRMPEYSEGLFYESAVSLDKRVKKYQRMLDARARDISDKLNLQAEFFFKQQESQKNIVATKKSVIILFVFTAIAIALSAYSIYNSRAGTRIEPVKTAGVKRFLQESGIYSNQYTITSLDTYNGICKGVVKLHFAPHTDWALKMIASEIVENFKTVSNGKSLELNFIYEGNAYAMVSFSPVTDDMRFEFLNDGRK